MRYFLVDNGSLRASSVLNLRRIARELSKAMGLNIIPTSLLHSHRVSADELDGEQAINLEKLMVQFVEAGERSFTIIPLFIGPTGAIIDYFPSRLERLRRRFGKIDVQRTPFIYSELESGKADPAEVLASRVRETVSEHGLDKPKVVLVDHGSPVKTVTDVRNELSHRLVGLLGDEVQAVAPASMERREGEAFDFNEPLLENILRKDGWSEGAVVISLLFLSPGRHAGPNGDVAAICAKAETESKNLRTYMTGLIGTHPDIVPLLVRRLEMERILL